MNQNPIENLKSLLNKEGKLTLELKNLLNDCELSMRENIRNYYLNEKTESDLFPQIDSELSIQNNSSKTIKQFRVSSLEALNYLEKNNLKQEIIYFDLSQETFNIKGKNLNKNTQESLENWFGFITNRMEKISNILSDDGILFISVDDEILAETKLIADKYLKRENYVNTLIFDTPDVSPHIRFLNKTKEYVLVYKGTKIKEFNRKKINKDSKVKYNKLDRTRKYRADYDYAIKIPNTVNEFAYAGGSKTAWENRQKGNFNTNDWKWMLTEEEFNSRLSQGLIKFEKEDNIWKVYNAYNTSQDVPYSDRIIDDSYIKGKNELEKYIGKISKRKNKPLSFFSYLFNLYPFRSKNLSILNLNGDDGSFEEAILLNNLENISVISVFDSKQNTYNDLNVVQKRLFTILEKGSLIKDTPNLIGGFDLEIINFTDDVTMVDDFSEIKTIENTKEFKDITENILKFFSSNKEVYIIKNNIIEELDSIYNDYSPEKEVIVYLKEKDIKVIEILFNFGLNNLKFL